uniref:Thioredoxin domain-containing protein n=1 Tax=Pseudictyota dubia TaxID=2749911 RepID=A0A7R9W4F2_9STRA|mmetsp:Transcript_31151/g.57563  ORF Transcript_31151/g.57563 Transcript_31151/m.57563 type:complete len:158 (+) Transcript_31151:424-897(+)
MKRFVDQEMPNFIERISGPSGLQSFEEKAERNGLPRVLIFTSKANTVPLTKYLSTEFRRRMLIGEVHPTKPNKEIMDKYGVKDLPAMIVFSPGTDEEEGAKEPVVYDGDGFTKNKLHSFLSNHALKDPVFPKKKTEGDEEQKQKEEEEKKKKQKEEL